MRAPLAAIVLVASAALAWVEWEGRGLDRWVLVAGRYLAGSRQGNLAATSALATVPEAAGGALETPAEPQAASGPRALGPLSRLPAWRRPREKQVGSPSMHPAVWSGTRIIAVVSLSGGAGKTTVAAALGSQLASRGRIWSGEGQGRRPRVAALDWDLRSGDLALRLGLEGGCPWEAPSLEPADLPSWLRRHSSGLTCAPGPASSYEADHDRVRELADRGPGLIDGLAAAGYDLVLVDCAAGVDPLVRVLAGLADDLLYVLPATPSGVQDAYRAAEAFRRLGAGHRLRLLSNRLSGHWPQDRLLRDLGWTDWGSIGDLRGLPSSLTAPPDDRSWTSLARRVLPSLGEAAAGSSLAGALGRDPSWAA